jgi:lipopolysaccharide transport system permease protein
MYEEVMNREVGSVIEASQEKGSETTARDDPAAALPEMIIEPRPGWHMINFEELWKSRELLWFLIWRDIKVRYKQTVLGVLWAILQPLAIMLVFVAFFGQLASMQQRNVPYPLFFYSGLLLWFFFANAVSSASNSIIGDRDLITKIYFPRLLIPLASVATALVDFTVGFVLLFLMILLYGLVPPLSFLLAPVIVLSLLLTALGVGSFLAALTVNYRDFRYVVPFMIQLWMFATPTIFMQTYTEFNPTWRIVLPFNPVEGMISTFRAAVFGRPIDWGIFSISLAVGILMFGIGCFYFRRVERAFADFV